jgi:hypothetical protein
VRLYKIFFPLLSIYLLASCTKEDYTPAELCDNDTLELVPDSALEFANAQLSMAVENLSQTNRYPRSTHADGSWKLSGSNDWVSGFFPGNLWYLFEYTQDAYWEEKARAWTANLEINKNNTTTHDLGFMMFTSFGNGYRLTGDPTYKEILLQSASSLASRFNPQVGCIKSWDVDYHEFPVIIDNMMNLELLFWATKVSGDSSFYKIAETHALTTLAHHLRPDHSVYQLVDFNPTTGKPMWKGNHQGYKNETSWARGQSWGVYGFTMCYRETGNTVFLQAAENIAEYVLGHPHLPCDGVPYWDYEAPDITRQPRDASAGAVLCSALLELSGYVPEKSVLYLDKAEAILTALSSPAYTATLGTNNYFILKHSTGHLPAGEEIDAPLVYADYYYIEALLRYIHK